MTDAQIRKTIRLGIPFFAVTAKGDILARYLPLGPVFRWQKNRMLPLPLDTEDLCWWLEGHSDEDHTDTQ